MSDAGLPEDLQRFIARYIQSVEKLEILLLLYNGADKGWSEQEVFQKIQSSVASISQKLKDLIADGFVQRESNDRFRFQPKSKELSDYVAGLHQAYQQRRIKVIEAIFSKSTEELRNFADAFRLRKDNE